MNPNVDSFRSVSRFNSLSFRLLVGMLFWLMCAFIFTGYTLLLSWELEKGGMAINDAGSLRKRTFQMALTYNYSQGESAELRQQQNDFEQVLHNLRNVGSDKLFIPQDDQLHEQVSVINTRWHDRILPWYQNLSTNHRLINTDNRQVIDDYANDINHLVKLLEEDNTRNIQLLRLFQMLLIVMTFVTAITGIYLLYRLVISPLDSLRGGIVRLALGDLKARVQQRSQDEFGIVAQGFNQMAQNLQEAHSNLAQKVAEKTEALAGKNHELTNLYGVTAFLHESHNIEAMGQGFVSRMVRMTRAQSASIRLLDPEHKALKTVAMQGLTDELTQSNALCAHPHQCQCSQVMQQAFEAPVGLARLDVNDLPCRVAGFNDVRAYPIRFSDQELGLFTLYFTEQCPLTFEESRLIEALCAQLGVAIENQHLINRNQQYAISEERNFMAQGLHDSIAQTLSYLNLQTQMMESALQSQQYDDAQEYLMSIKSGVQESYDDVRELLLNFRTRLAEQNFNEAVQTVLKRFEAQAKVPTRLNVYGVGAHLMPQQQLQVIFILQEALSNVRKHAQAHEVNIDISNQENFIMTITDDGCGFDAQNVAHKQSRHVGTKIMQERAHKIHAQLNIHSQPGQGTQVSLYLPATQRAVL